MGNNILDGIKTPPYVILFVLVIVLVMIAPEYVKLMSVAFMFTLMLMLFANSRPTRTYTHTENPEKMPNVKMGYEILPNEFEEVCPLDVYAEIENAEMADRQTMNYEEAEFPWMSNTKYTSCYAPPPSDVNDCNLGAYLPFDEANARYAALRQRDKKARDGAAVKNANYFKKHFGKELSEAESERWWGNNEY